MVPSPSNHTHMHSPLHTGQLSFIETQSWATEGKQGMDSGRKSALGELTWGKAPLSTQVKNERLDT